MTGDKHLQIDRSKGTAIPPLDQEWLGWSRPTRWLAS